MERPPGIPSSSGCYLFRDAHGRVLYVGKARSLAARLSNYFAPPETLDQKTRGLMAAANSVEWIITATESEALILENELIKANQPRFNIRLKDDKSYPYLAIDTSVPYPVPYITRARRARGVRYFGPFAQVKSLRRVIDELLQAYPLRSCQSHKFKYHERLGRPCLLFDVQKCSGPCVNAVTPEEYQKHVADFASFFEGRAGALRRRLEGEMSSAAASREYERAARARDSLQALDRASETQAAVLDDESDLDCLRVTRDGTRAAVTIFRVRNGRVVGRSVDLVELAMAERDDDIVDAVITQRYETSDDVPPEFCTIEEQGLSESAREYLQDLRGKRISFAQPVRGRKRALLERMVADGIETLRRDSIRRAADHNIRAQALQSLASALDLAMPPYRIECFDMSHLQGTNYVGSMVVFQDGLATKKFYRHFNVRDVEGNNDVGAMNEVLRRRLKYVTADGGDRNFPNPDLIIVDGGLPQLGAAMAAFKEVGIEGIALAALAKREELLYRPGGNEPIRLDRGDEALYLVQRLRDEAHRFAISFHRSKRGRAMVHSALDGISGLGPARQARLVESAGSLDAVRSMSLEELLAITWLPHDVANRLYDALHGPSEGEGPIDG